MDLPITELSEEEKKILGNFQDFAAIEIDCGDFKAFYKPMTVDEDIEWTKQYLVDDGSGNLEVSGKELLKCKIHYNLNIRVPKKVIAALFQKEVEWKDLKKEEKYTLLTKKLNPVTARKIIAVIRNADEGTPEKKN